MKKLLVILTLLALWIGIGVQASQRSADRSRDTNVRILALAEKLMFAVAADELSDTPLSTDERAEAVAFALIVTANNLLEGQAEIAPNAVLDEAAKLVLAAKRGGAK